jgi:flagellar motor switch protein FliG
MLNMMDKNSEKNVMARVEEKDPELAEEIRKLMFVFEDLTFVDDKGIQELLKVVDNQKLTIALKTAPEEVKTKLFKNMSNRAATLLKEDLGGAWANESYLMLRKLNKRLFNRLKILKLKGKRSSPEVEKAMQWFNTDKELWDKIWQVNNIQFNLITSLA